MTRRGFSLVELIIAIIIISILATISSRNVRQERFYEAQNNILDSIKYTQSIALRDDKHSYNDPRWQRKYWRIIFSTCSGGGKYFMIGSDFDSSGASNGYFSKKEAAIDPVDGKPMWWYNAGKCDNPKTSEVSSRIFLTKKYDITSIQSYGGCVRQGGKTGHLGFDHMGRPHYGFSKSIEPNFASYLKEECRIEFMFGSGKKFSVIVEPESGYAHIQ